MKDVRSVDGRVDMPIAETFGATRFGILADRFGIAWMAGCAIPD